MRRVLHSRERLIYSKVHKGNQIRKLERDFKAMKDNYDKICSENRQLTLFTRQQKDKQKRRARDKALKEARDKARVEEEERQAVRDMCDKRR